MSKRKCPDCQGKGQLWVPHSQREQWESYEMPWVSSTAGGLRCTMRPEYEECLLCKGKGVVECRAIEEV
jgi:DnaJ-class molecular chaperone